MLVRPEQVNGRFCRAEIACGEIAGRVVGSGDAECFGRDAAVLDAVRDLRVDGEQLEFSAEAAEQESLESFVLEQVAGGSALPGTYPPNDETKTRFAAWRAARKG